MGKGEGKGYKLVQTLTTSSAIVQLKWELYSDGYSNGTADNELRIDNQEPQRASPESTYSRDMLLTSPALKNLGRNSSWN
jgi:hypothetical protein